MGAVWCKILGMHLNDAQYQAVTHPGGPLMILAGAGSGKTRVLTERVRYLISQGVPAREIMTVTFTNRAAREIIHRLGADGKDVQAGTFHSLAARLCRVYGVPSSSFRVLDEDDSYRVWRDLAREIEPDLDKATLKDGEKPTEVRYAWADFPICNLFNAAGLPASPFRVELSRE